jgi:hypothetical protein
MAGRPTAHKPGSVPVCCEQALKSVGERNTHGGWRCGDLRETARAREVALRGGMKRPCLIYKAAIWRRGLSPAGELSTGNIGSLREWQTLKALRASRLLADLYRSTLQLYVICYIINYCY